MVISRHVTDDSLLILRFTGSARNKKFYMPYERYIKALYNLQRFITWAFITNNIPDDMTLLSGDELAKLRRMGSKARTNLYRIFQNLKEFSSLGYMSITASEWVHGAVPVPNAKTRKLMAEMAHIYLRDLPRYETYHDMRESKPGMRAYRYMHKHRIKPERVEFYNYPNKDELRNLGYVEVPSIKYLEHISRNLMSDQSFHGYHQTSENELIEMLLRNTYAAIVHNSLVDIRVNQNIVFTCDKIGECLVNLYHEYSGMTGMPTLRVSQRMIDMIFLDPVTDREDVLREVVENNDLVVRFIELIDRIKEDFPKDQIPEYKISYNPQTIRMIEDSMNEKFPEVFNMMKVFQGASFYASEFLF